MPKRWIEYLGGFITVKIKGSSPERIINKAISRGIFLWDLKRKDDGLEAKVRLSGFEPLLDLADLQHEIEVKERSGMPFWRSKLESRSMLAIGALIFVISLYFLSSLVWDIEVKGNHTVTKSEILACAAANGLYKGSFKWNFSRDQVQNELLKRFPALSFVEIDVRGVTTTITVVEKVLPPDEIKGPCHVVASRDGVVIEVLPLEGQPLVKPGDVVSAGQILISGIVFPETDYTGNSKPPYAVHARGEVRARVWYDGYGEWPLIAPYWQETGRSLTRLVIRAKGKEKVIFAWGDKEIAHPKEVYSRWSLPFPPKGRLYVVSLREEVKKERTYSEQQAMEKAKERAYASVKDSLAGCEKVLNTTWHLVSTPSEDIVRMKVVVEAETNIARQQPVRLEEGEEEPQT